MNAKVSAVKLTKHVLHVARDLEFQLQWQINHAVQLGLNTVARETL